MLGTKRTSTSEASAFSAKRPSHCTTLELNTPRLTHTPSNPYVSTSRQPQDHQAYEPTTSTNLTTEQPPPHCSKPPETPALIKDARGVTETGRQTTDQNSRLSSVHTTTAGCQSNGLDTAPGQIMSKRAYGCSWSAFSPAQSSSSRFQRTQLHVVAFQLLRSPYRASEE